MKLFSSPTQKIGEEGEEATVRFLEKEGYRILERNVANKYGEIDIVAKKGGVHYFFEVKAGREGGYINPAENLTKAKLRKVFISVEYYVLTHDIREYRIQGVIALLGKEGVTVEVLDLY